MINMISRAFVVASVFGSTPALAETPSAHETTTLQTSEEMDAWGGMGGVTVDQAGYIWQSNFASKVWRIHPGTGDVTLYSDQFSAASGNTALPDGDILQADFSRGEIWKLDGRNPAAATLFSNEGLSGPVGLVAVDGRGVFVANCFDGTIGRIGLEGGPAETFASHEKFNCPNGITADDDGNLYVVNNQDTRVFKITPDGETIQISHLPGIGHGHVTFAQGALYIAQLWNHALVRLGLDGDNYEVIAGDGRPGLADGLDKTARVTHPNGIAAADRGRVLIHNSLNGPMMTGDRASLVLRQTYLPSFRRDMLRVYEEGGVSSLLRAYDNFATDMEKNAISGQTGAVGIFLFQRGENEAGLRLLERDLENAGENFDRLVALADAHATYGNRKRARLFYQRAIALNPDDENAPKRLEALDEY